MHLVQVDPVGTQAAQAVLDRGEDPPPRVAAAVAALAHLEVHLGRQHHLVPAAAQRFADDLLGLAGRVHVGGVDDVDAALQRGVDDPYAVVVVGVADGAEHHGSEAVHAHLDAGAPQDAVSHGTGL